MMIRNEFSSSNNFFFLANVCSWNSSNVCTPKAINKNECKYIGQSIRFFFSKKINDDEKIVPTHTHSIYMSVGYE